MQYGDPQFSLNNFVIVFIVVPCKLRREELITTKQTLLEQFFLV
jgi:hypothetical protein